MTRFLLLLLTVFAFPLLSGCLGTTNFVVPDRFATISEVYPPTVAEILPPGLPVGSNKKANFAAPYEDVFRAVIESTGQALLNIEASDKNSGLILATKATRVPNAWDAPANRNYEAERRHFFAIVVAEKGAESTDVQIVTRVQTSCQYNDSYGDDVCEKEATVQYATDFWHSSMTEMNNLITFIRNNLYAAGVL